METIVLDSLIPGGRGKVRRGPRWLSVTWRPERWRVWRHLHPDRDPWTPGPDDLWPWSSMEQLTYLTAHFSQFHGNVQSWGLGSKYYDGLTRKGFWELVRMTVKHCSWKQRAGLTLGPHPVSPVHMFSSRLHSLVTDVQRPCVASVHSVVCVCWCWRLWTHQRRTFEVLDSWDVWDVRVWIMSSSATERTKKSTLTKSSLVILMMSSLTPHTQRLRQRFQSSEDQTRVMMSLSMTSPWPRPPAGLWQAGLFLLRC